jgi:hypothetical protein
MFYTITKSNTSLGKFYRYKYKKWKELKHMVSSQYTSTFDIYYISYKMLLQATYNDILTKFDNRLKKKSNKIYELTYYIEGTKYLLPLSVKRGPLKFIDATNEKNESIFLILKQYLLPNGTLNNKIITPNYLGYKSVIIDYIDGRTIEFKGSESILIN